MRVVISGSDFPELQTFKRLLLLADEIVFLDRPSVMFGNWGTVGHASNIRSFQTEGLPVKLSAHTPPSGQDEGLYASYLETDLHNPRFLQIVLDGLAKDDRFANRLIQLQGNYGAATGKELRDAVVSDPAVMNGDKEITMNPEVVYRLDTSAQRQETFKHIVVEASIRVTSTLLVAEEEGLIPVSDDPFLSRLLALRTYDASYVGQTPRVAPSLGIAIATAVVPDEVVGQLQIGDILDYRQDAKPAYDAWTVELDRLGATIGEMDPDAIERQLPTILAKEVNPRVAEYKRELTNVLDRMFGDLVKGVATWQVPSLSIAYLASLNFSHALALYASAVVVPAVPTVVNYYLDRRKLQRTNSYAYLVGLSERADD
jgi:hypothetical protein